MHIQIFSKNVPGFTKAFFPTLSSTNWNFPIQPLTHMILYKKQKLDTSKKYICTYMGLDAPTEWKRSVDFAAFARERDRSVRMDVGATIPA